MMKCDLCGATVPATMETKHVTGVIDDKINGHIHVCDRCFKENNIKPIHFHFSVEQNRFVATHEMKELPLFRTEYLCTFADKKES